MRSALLLSLLLVVCSTSVAARQLTVSDVRELMATAGFNPGTTRRINGSLHQLVSVQVTGKNGRWRVTIEEREISPQRETKR